MGSTYSKEFKVRAVRVSRQDDVTCKEVANDLGMSVTSLHRWRKQYREHGDDAFPGRGNPAHEEKTSASPNSSVRTRSYARSGTS